MPSAVVTAVVLVHDEAKDTDPAQMPNVEARRGFDESYESPRRSFTSGVMGCAVFQFPVLVSLTATGVRTTVGVIVDEPVRPSESLD